MKKAIGTLALLLSVQLVGAGLASAAYDPAGDTTVNVTTGYNLPLSSATGTLSFQLQEAVHNTLTDLTGVEIDHSYIWVNVNGVNVLAIDPPRPMY
ncbi:MAG: hypothetical protein WCC10_13075 [Tumebacillaceae bacterium]